jgi:predicted xylose isomerase-like sugar epimerase
MAIQEIRKRSGHTDATPEDVVAMAVEVFNVLTEHLSQKDSKVILYTQGVGLKTLEITSSSTSAIQGVRTIKKRVQPPKPQAGGR